MKNDDFCCPMLDVFHFTGIWASAQYANIGAVKSTLSSFLLWKFIVNGWRSVDTVPTKFQSAGNWHGKLYTNEGNFLTDVRRLEQRIRLAMMLVYSRWWVHSEVCYLWGSAYRVQRWTDSLCEICLWWIWLSPKRHEMSTVIAQVKYRELRTLWDAWDEFG